jgi:hypothetical protein
MLATFAFDVCHDVYRAAREAIDTKISTLNLESSGKYTWHPDRLPRLAEFVADFARSGERALGGGMGTDGYRDGSRGGHRYGYRAKGDFKGKFDGNVRGKLDGDFKGKINGNFNGNFRGNFNGRQAEACPTGASRMVMFRVYYLGGAEYQLARRHLGISELTWADWAEEIRTRVGQELTRAGVFPPSKYFRETSARAS